MNQLIEMIVLNEFADGISVYSTIQMNYALHTFNHYILQKQINRQKLAKLIRDNNNLIHSGRGQYIHSSKLLFICYRRKKATSNLLAAIVHLVNFAGSIDGQKTFDLLQNLCASLELTNPYALYGFIECFKPKTISYNQNKIGVISYQRRKCIQD